MMGTINKIMVAVDFSSYSAHAVQYAARLARVVDANLLLVNVINQRDVDTSKKIASMLPEFCFEDYLEEMHSDREGRFKRLIRDSGCENERVETSLRIGVPHQELIRAVNDEKPDLLVIAVKGHGNLVTGFGGSCAHKIFRHCPIPLLSIRGDSATS